MAETLNAWGESPDPVDDGDGYTVPEDERLDVDEGPDSDALDDETGDDMGGWTPGNEEA